MVKIAAKRSFSEKRFVILGTLEKYSAAEVKVFVKKAGGKLKKKLTKKCAVAIVGHDVERSDMKFIIDNHIDCWNESAFVKILVNNDPQYENNKTHDETLAEKLKSHLAYYQKQKPVYMENHKYMWERRKLDWKRINEKEAQKQKGDAAGKRIQKMMNQDMRDEIFELDETEAVLDREVKEIKAREIKEINLEKFRQLKRTLDVAQAEMLVRENKPKMTIKKKKKKNKKQLITFPKHEH